MRVNELEVQLADLAVREPSLANQLRDAETRVSHLYLNSSLRNKYLRSRGFKQRL